MGAALSWLAVKGKDRQSLLDELELKATGKKGEFFDYKLCGQTLESGEFLLITDNCDHPFQSTVGLARISAYCEVIACSIEEHVMYSMATAWKEGKELWCIEHRGGDKGRTDLTVTGTPPEGFKDAKQENEGQADWYFEMPLALARELTGFKHDEVIKTLDGKYEQLVAAYEAEGAKAKKPWWKFW